MRLSVENNETVYDVAVIGAGPMGSFAADCMALKGLSVVLLEKDGNPGDSTVCAGGMHRDVAQYISIPENAVEKKLNGFRLRNGLHVKDWKFTKEMYYMINRRKLDFLLAQRAQKNGVKIITNAKVIDVLYRQGELFYLSGALGARERIAAKAFVFADGPHSLSEKILGTPQERSRTHEYWGYAYDIESQGNSMDHAEIIIDKEKLPFGYFWIFPKKDHLNVGLGHPKSILGKSLPELLNGFIEGREDLKGKKILAKKCGIIPMALNPVIQKENCMVIGDAAGMVNPITGGGYICGFLSAKICSEICIRAFNNGLFDPKYFRNYKRRIYLSKHYISLYLAHCLIKLLMTTFRHGRKSFYPQVLRAYLYFSHFLIKYVKVF